jgi:hypothetical protein
MLCDGVGTVQGHTSTPLSPSAALHWVCFHHACPPLLLLLLCHRPQLARGLMQLFSVEQQKSQPLEAHAAAFSTVKVRPFIHCISNMQAGGSSMLGCVG